MLCLFYEHRFNLKYIISAVIKGGQAIPTSGRNIYQGVKIKNVFYILIA